MLFYGTEKDLDNIPSEHIIIYVGYSKWCSTGTFNNLFVPSDVTDAKKSLKRNIKDNKEYLIPILTILDYKKEYNSDIVILSNTDDNKYNNINISKEICEYINKKYDYPVYEFTNDIFPKMRRGSKFSQKGRDKLTTLLLKYRDKIK